MKRKLQLLRNCFFAMLVTGSFTAMSQTNFTMTTLMNEAHFPHSMSPNMEYVSILSLTMMETSYVWQTPGQTTEILGTIAGMTDEGKVCGTYNHEISQQKVAGYWQDGTWTSLGMHPDYPNFVEGSQDYSSAWCMNAAGTIIAGMQWTEAWTTLPFTWTQEGGYVTLPTVNNRNGRPNDMNTEGDVICGWIESDMGWWQPAVWQDGELTVITTEDGEASRVSRNGMYVVGNCIDPSTGGQAPFIWSEANGIQMIANTIHPDGATMVSTTCVTDNGDAFGFTNSNFPPMPSFRVAFAKTADGEMTTFNDYLIARGWGEVEENAADWTFITVSNVTADGNTFIGSAQTPEGDFITFMLTIEEESSAINENEIATTQVYPNPAQNVINVNFSGNNGTATIVDMQGRTIMQTPLNNANSTISTESLTNGLYFVIVEGDNARTVNKITIQK